VEKKGKLEKDTSGRKNPREKFRAGGKKKNDPFFGERKVRRRGLPLSINLWKNW